MFSRVLTSGKSVAKSGVRISQGVTAAGNMSTRQYSHSAFAMKSVETVAAKYETHSQGGTDYEKRDAMQGDHIGRQQNHIWTKEEIDYHLKTLTHHKPVTFSDKVMNGIMSTLYHTFNFITGYKEVNPTVKAIQWRLIVLESFAGVPGFVAAGFRHFKSLRMLKRDHGWIATLLEEAENERMHLLVCLKMFDASWVTRSLVICAQFSMTPFLFITYLIKPQAMHRFVGYLEETACKTYKNVIEHAEKPGNEIHEKWNKLPAPEMAINYWKLPSDATFVDTLKCMFADETHHRDVNHTFAQMDLEDPNPFIAQHRANALRALQLEKEGKSAWPSHKEEEEAAAAAAAAAKK